MPEGDTLFAIGFNALAEQCGHTIRIPEGSALLMETVTVEPGAGDAALVIRVHVIVPHTIRRGYDFDGEAEDDTPELPAPQ